MDEDIKIPGDWQNVDSSQNKGTFTSLGGHFIDFIQTLVIFGAIFALIYLFVAQPHKVSGSSMFPNFHDGDYILTDKVTYKLGDPKRDDIVVFKNPQDESQDFIKRVIAVPGDIISVENEKVYLNETELEEDYLPLGTPTNPRNFLTEGLTVKADPNQYFVLGDNREHSSDSREWGAITKEVIIGKAFFRYWPPQVFGLIKSHPSN